MDLKQHWEKVYATKSDQDVGWTEEYPAISLSLVNKYISKKDAPIIDIGGGNSFLSKILCIQGFKNPTIIDISANALERNKINLGIDSEKVTHIETNVLDFSSDTKFELWHDRVMFHFLTIESEINRYVEVAAKNMLPGGYLIIGTFSDIGPETCSGLSITQYDKDNLIKVFVKDFELVEHFDDVHTTPSGNPQNFIWAVFKRRVKNK